MRFNPRTKFIDRGGWRLAYQVVDTGVAEHVVWYQDVAQHLDLFWTDESSAEAASLLARDDLASVLLQERGVGLSDPVERKATIDEQASDLVAVLDAEELTRATLVGTSSTALPVALVAAQHPERVKGIVLIAPVIVGPAVSDTEFGWTPEIAREAIEGYRRVARDWGTGAALEMWDPNLITPYHVQLFAMAERCSASAAMAEAVFEHLFATDGRAIYPEVRVPARVLRVGQPTFPDEVVRAVADAIPGAEYHVLEPPQTGDSMGHSWKQIARHVAEVARGAEARYGELDRVLASVVFTDIVGSTDQLARLGDSAWAGLLEDHDRLLRRNVASRGGRYVGSTGDGALCEFASPAAAVDCARSVCAAAGELGIQIRAGVHTGECERRGEDLAGIAVHIGARVCAAAKPGEVLVTGTVRDLIAGSELTFEERGPAELKGVPGSWELHAAVGTSRPPSSAGPSAPRPRAADRLVVEVSRRAPGALRSANRVASALQRRWFDRRSRARG